MNPDDNLQDLAGAYVLGTLPAGSRREVERRMAAEPALREAVGQWEQRLLPLTALAAEVPPSPALWERIARSTAGDPAARRAAPGRPAADSAWATWWNSLPLWRGLAVAATAAALVLAVLPVLRPAPGGPRYVVVLVTPQDQAPGWVVQAAVRGDAVDLVPLRGGEVPAGKALQFWTKADGWQGPVSLGLVRPGQRLHVPLASLPPLVPNQLFELTLEPAQGSPIGRPTGPIQFIGRAVEML